MHGLIPDLRYAARGLRKNPGFAAIAVLSLAVGLGANTTIFSVLNAVLIQPLPFPNASRLVKLDILPPGKSQPAGTFPWSFPKYRFVAETARGLEAIALYSSFPVNLTGTDKAERVVLQFATPSLFPLLGQQPASGRLFTADEQSVVLGHGFWKRRFGGDPGIVGTTIHLNRQPVVVAGVMPESFRGVDGDAELWAPVNAAPVITGIPARLRAPHMHWATVVGLRRDSVSMSALLAELKSLESPMAQAFPFSGKLVPYGIGARALKNHLLEDGTVRYGWMVFGALAFLMLIVCVNLAGLMLGRALTRRREIAVRLSLGGRGWDLFRLIATESLLIGFLGSLGGLVLSVWSLDLVNALQAETAPPVWSRYATMLGLRPAQLDPVVIVFHVAITLGCVFLFGLLPAFRLLRSELQPSLREHGGAGAGDRIGRIPVRQILVAAEVALAVPLLVGGVLFTRSLLRMLDTPLGFRSGNLLTAFVSLPPRTYEPERALRFWQDLRESAAAIPGVEAAAVGSSYPGFGAYMSMGNVRIPNKGDDNIGGFHMITPGYFETLGVSVKRGRGIQATDNSAAPRVAVLNETAARTYFGNEDPIGKRIGPGIAPQPGYAYEVVGIVPDVRYLGYDKPAQADIYLSLYQIEEGGGYIVLRSRQPASTLTAELRERLARLDRDLPLYNIKTIGERISDATRQTRWSASLLLAFSTLAALLAAIGLFGVMSHAVTSRTKEIGVRIALGAEPSRLVREFLRQGLVVVTIGLVLGVALAAAFTRVLRSQLYQTQPLDPASYVWAAVLLILVGAIASLAPSLRAARTDPVRALRAE